MYDIHAHILPDVDDGARTMPEAVEMARIASENGTVTILATPHKRDVSERSSIEAIKGRMSDFVQELSAQDINLEVLLGMENHLDLELPEDFEQGHALRINQSRYALVEMPFFGHPNYMEDVLFQIQLQGITPVLAHPERIEAIQRDADLLRTFVERGMLTQITSGSIVGHFGRSVRRFTHTLLRRGLVHIVSSDTHMPKGPRSPQLKEGLSAATKIVGEEKSLSMFIDTPRDVLQDLPVKIEPPGESESPKRWWHLWSS